MNAQQDGQKHQFFVPRNKVEIVSCLENYLIITITEMAETPQDWKSAELSDTDFDHIAGG